MAAHTGGAADNSPPEIEKRREANTMRNKPKPSAHTKPAAKVQTVIRVPCDRKRGKFHIVEFESKGSVDSTKIDGKGTTTDTFLAEPITGKEPVRMRLINQESR